MASSSVTCVHSNHSQRSTTHSVEYGWVNESRAEDERRSAQGCNAYYVCEATVDEGAPLLSCKLPVEDPTHIAEHENL